MNSFLRRQVLQFAEAILRRSGLQNPPICTLLNEFTEDKLVDTVKSLIRKELETSSSKLYLELENFLNECFQQMLSSITNFQSVISKLGEKEMSFLLPLIMAIVVSDIFSTKFEDLIPGETKHVV